MPTPSLPAVLVLVTALAATALLLVRRLDPTTSRRVLGAVAGGLLLLGGVTACSPTSGTETVGSAVVTTKEDCATLFAQPLLPHAKKLVVVADRTRSNATTDFGEIGVDRIEAAAKARASLDLIMLDGPGARPTVLLDGVSLNFPTVGSDTQQFATAVSRSVTCVSRAIDGFRPTAPGTDLGAGLRSVAARLDGRHAEILVKTDGISTGDLRTAGRIATASIPRLIAAQRTAGAIPSFAGDRFTAVGVGRVSQRIIPIASARWLTGWMTALCAAAEAHPCAVPDADQSTSATQRPGLLEGLPADPLPDLPSSQSFSIAGDALFAPGSPTLGSSAKHALRDVVLCLQSGVARRVVVEGWAARTGESGAVDDATLSAQRASATKDYLVSAAHIDPSIVTAIGRGTATGAGAASRRAVSVTTDAC